MKSSQTQGQGKKKQFFKQAKLEVAVQDKYKSFFVGITVDGQIVCLIPAECVIIMADKHTSETGYFSLKEKGRLHAQATWFHVNRALSGNCHHCITDGDTVADAESRQRAGQARGLPEQSQAVDTGLDHVRR